MKAPCLFVLFFVCASGIVAAEKHQTGSFQLTGMTKIDDRAGGHMEFVRRMGWKMPSGATDDSIFFKIQEVTAEVYVPDDYDKDVSYGLIVWINSGDSGKIPAEYKELLKKHKLIWAGANKGGNKVDTETRVNMAKDIRANMMELYNIEPNRVYVSGSSGGGRASSLAAFSFPELFKGGIFCIGVNCWKNVPLEGSKYSPTKWGTAIPAKRLSQIKTEGRYAFMTGDKDYNRLETKQKYDVVFSKAMDNAAYYQVPGLGHERIPAEWYEKAIVQLDGPMKLIAEGFLQKARSLAASRQYADAANYLSRAIAYDVEGAKAEYDALASKRDEYTLKAENLLDEGNYYQAYQLNKKLVSVYGAFAVKATEKLAMMESDEVLKKEISADAYFTRAEESFAKKDSETFKQYLSALMEKFPDSKATAKAKAKWPGSPPVSR